MDETHKRSKSQTMNSVSAKKSSKSHEQSVLLSKRKIYIYRITLQLRIIDIPNQSANAKACYNLINEYLENPGKVSKSNFA